MLLIPTVSDGSLFEYIETVALDGTAYAIKLSWNEQLDHWVLSLAAANGDPIVNGKMVINGTDFLRGCTVAGRPPGALLAVPLDGVNEHAGFTGLGSRVELYYRELAEAT
jgi:hypothetical protein